MTILTAPVGRLADHIVTLRLPSPDAGDVATVDNYIQQEQLGGGWLPDVPLVTGRQLVADWLDGWAGRPSHNGPAFVVTVPQHSRFIGVVGMNERDDGNVEISYGIAPRWRGRGLATHAAFLCSQWIASQPGVHRSGWVVVADGQLAVGQADLDHGAVAGVPGDPGAGDGGFDLAGDQAA